MKIIQKYAQRLKGMHPLADPGFPRGRQLPGGCANLLFCKIFAKNCPKMKEFGPEGRISAALPWIPTGIVFGAKGETSFCTRKRLEETSNLLCLNDDNHLSVGAFFSNTCKMFGSHCD